MKSRQLIQGQFSQLTFFLSALATICTALLMPAPAQAAPPAQAAEATVMVQAGAPGTKISPDLFGVFFEDINYAADGGLYAELVQNRSFEYSEWDHEGWNSLTAWQLVERGEGKGKVAVESAMSLHANNPHYAVLTVEQGGGGVGLMNSGFDGIVLNAGKRYDFSCFVRREAGHPGPLVVRLESKTGTVYGEATLADLTNDWSKYTATLQTSTSDTDARLVLLANGVGAVALDTVSLFPQETFRNRPNGLRADLAQTIADLKPRFLRFPGGCLVHGQGLGEIYRWKETIGPIEQRKEQRNLWSYHQSMGLGYFEYFQFCEDIGAKPIPVLAAGVTCQFPRGGQYCLPLDQMKDYVQDVLDLVEYANGPTNSTWGAKRAAAGHPAPFHLEYLGIGNEDALTPEFKERFKMIYDAMKAKYPEITVIGTVGPFAGGADFDEGWKFADHLDLKMVDEHYYMPPDWFLDNLNRYDSYDRAKSKVYLGEYASQGSKWFNALAEAAYLTGLERNGDIVHLASYAPLLAKAGHTQWNPDLIYFDTTSVLRTVSYYVQQLYSVNAGDVYLPNTVSLKLPPPSEQAVSVFLGTWDTQAQFDDVRLESGTNVLLQETFDTSADGWRAESGAWAVTDGVYSQSDNPQPAVSRAIAAPITGIAGKHSYTLSLRARKTGGREGFLIGFGATDADNDYWWNIGGWDNQTHAIQRHRNGAGSMVGESVPGHVETGRWYDIKIVVEGRHFQCFLDGQLIHDVVDDSKSPTDQLVASTVRDSQTGDTILKLVNVSPFAVRSQVVLGGLRSIKPEAGCTILAGEPMAANSFTDPLHIVPQTSSIKVGKTFSYSAPPHSLNIIRLKTR